MSGGRVIFLSMTILFFQNGLVSGWTTEGSPCRLGWWESRAPFSQSPACCEIEPWHLWVHGSEGSRRGAPAQGLLPWWLDHFPGLLAPGAPSPGVVTYLVYKGCSAIPMCRECCFQNRPIRGWASIPMAVSHTGSPYKGPMTISSFLFPLLYSSIDV